MALPPVPVPHDQLVRYIADHADTPMSEIMEPYRLYEAELRSVFAQDRANRLLADPHLNVLPLFTDETKLITARARDLAAESPEEKSRFIMQLPDHKRRAHGSPAVVADMREFQKNFAIFSESSLAEMNWDNVVAAGSSVINCLLPVPAEYNISKRSLREYYHQIFCPASDVDLFLYGLTHEQAIDKIKQIEKAIRDAILTEVTVVRTKYAITIASQYPTRHVQIVLRVYKSIGEILTGFDIDAAGGAYNGHQVFVTPRALGSFITQINHVDLTRRSPSYENRLSKYSRRAFEIYWPDLDRTRIDPTIFERSFSRCLGLARLLVLERLPTSSARDEYINKRRTERGRPAFQPFRFRLGGNIKDNFEDEVADWVSEADVSNYHTFTVPYGQNFHAKKIEKLCYTRDLLLNAEWNQHKDRAVYLHRHPAFFGRVEDVVEDCCGACPAPATDEELDVAAKESAIYISGKVSFLIDDPGRQQIGSFNPLTQDDWTDMAYVGNTARLCQSIVDGAADEVRDWLGQEGADPNQRDYTGRTPLQLAVLCSTPEVVQVLVDGGARLTARLLDGRTALHLAAARGSVEMIKTLMDKSAANEEIEEEREDGRRRARRAASQSSRGSRPPAPATPSKPESDGDHGDEDEDEDEDGDEAMDEDGVMIEAPTTDADQMSTTSGSFVKVTDGDVISQEAAIDGTKDEPDIYKIDVLAWDVPCSPLHLAIAHGHEGAVQALREYGADTLLPVKFLDGEKQPTAAILSMVLAAALPADKASSMAKLLLGTGATSAQADMNGRTVLHRIVEKNNIDLLDVLLEHDRPGSAAALKSMVWTHSNLSTPLTSAVAQHNAALALRVLRAGARPEIDFRSWVDSGKLTKAGPSLGSNQEQNLKQFHGSVMQPLLDIITKCPDPDLVAEMLDRGADPNVLSPNGYQMLAEQWYRDSGYYRGETALDMVQQQLQVLREWKDGKEGKECGFGDGSGTGDEEKAQEASPPPGSVLPRGIDKFLATLPEGSYTRWKAEQEVSALKKARKQAMYEHEKKNRTQSPAEGMREKAAAVRELIADFEKIERILVERGAKTFEELHPGMNRDKATGKATVVAKMPAEAEEDKPFEYAPKFQGIRDMTDARQEAYLKIFEAAWAGDIETIKTYTLGVWGENQEEPPLGIGGVVDGFPWTGISNNPFSIAVLRGHWEVARAILDIVKAQYEPDEEEKKLIYKIAGEGDGQDDEDGDAHSQSDGRSQKDDDDDVKVVACKVGDKRFVIDDIGTVAIKVRSKTRPISVLLQAANSFETTSDGKTGPPCPRAQTGQHTLFTIALQKKDQKMLNFLIDLGIHYSKLENGGEKQDSDGSGSGSAGFVFPIVDFTWAIEHGPVYMLADIIRRTGAAIPLDHLVRKSGAEVRGKPKSYQGLTVYGRKRRDWANAGRNLVVRSIGFKTSPLLFAARSANPETIGWFLGDSPTRLYLEYGQSKEAQADTRLRHLTKAVGGLERAISRWLGAQNDLVIHCLIMSAPTDQAQLLLRSLIVSYPHTLEIKTTSGETPFLLACILGRLEFVEILIKAGADQSVRNVHGANALHLGLSRRPGAKKLRALLNLLDRDLLPHLFTQRNNLTVSGTTPLHTWLNSVWLDQANPGHYQVLRLMLEYSAGAELEMLNGAGDTILHSAVMGRADRFVEALLEYRPSLLLRENAVGRTPAEVARDLLTAQEFSQPQQIFRSETRRAETVTQGGPAEFIGTSKREWLAAEPGHMSRPWQKQQRQTLKGPRLVWDVIARFAAQLEAGAGAAAAAEQAMSKRRLVSLGEANDVARRLGEQYRGADKTINLQRRGRDHDPRMPDVEVKSDDGEGAGKADFVASNIGGVMTAWCGVSVAKPCKRCGVVHGSNVVWEPKSKGEEEDEGEGSKHEGEKEEGGDGGKNAAEEKGEEGVVRSKEDEGGESKDVDGDVEMK